MKKSQRKRNLLNLNFNLSVDTKFIIKLSSDNAINSHLKNVNILLNGLNDEINKINEEINHLPINEDKNTNKEIKREKANNYI